VVLSLFSKMARREKEGAAEVRIERVAEII